MEKNNLFNNDKQPIDIKTNYGKGLESKIDLRTDYGKGIMYKSVDGKEWETMKQVETANKEYFDTLMVEPNDYLEEAPKHHR